MTLTITRLLHYAVSHFFTIMLNVIMLSDIMLSVVTTFYWPNRSRKHSCHSCSCEGNTNLKTIEPNKLKNSGFYYIPFFISNLSNFLIIEIVSNNFVYLFLHFNQLNQE